MITIHVATFELLTPFIRMQYCHLKNTFLTITFCFPFLIFHLCIHIFYVFLQFISVLHCQWFGNLTFWFLFLVCLALLFCYAKYYEYLLPQLVISNCIFFLTSSISSYPHTNRKHIQKSKHWIKVLQLDFVTNHAQFITIKVQWPEIASNAWWSFGKQLFKKKSTSKRFLSSHKKKTTQRAV